MQAAHRAFALLAFVVVASTGCQQPPAPPPVVPGRLAASAPASGAPAVAAAKSTVRLAGGATHSCAIDSGGQVVCWGGNHEGQCGAAARGKSAVPTVVPGLGDVTAISAGFSHTCALDGSGSVWCWGGNSGGELGIAGEHMSPTPVRLASPSDLQQVSAGTMQTCGLRRGGQVLCWGNPLRPFQGKSEPQPVAVAGTGSARPMVRVAAGSNHHCALDGSGGVWCWDTKRLTRAVAGNLERIDGLPGSTDVGVGNSFGCALGADRLVRCWGESRYAHGQPLPGERPNHARVVGGVDQVAQLTVASQHACVLRLDGSVWCWGSNQYGQLAHERLEPSPPLEIGGLPPIVNISSGQHHVCAASADGEVFCWGQAGFGQLGVGTEQEVSPRPVPVPHLGQAKRVATGWVEGCALTNDGGVMCWNDPRNTGTAYLVGSVAGASDLAVDDAGCALVKGRAWCWAGTLWQGRKLRAADPRRVAVQVPRLRGLQSIAATWSRFCAIDTAGSVWCWGGAVPGGGGGTVQGYGPVQVPQLRGAVQLALGRNQRGCARLRDGSVSCWPLADLASNPPARKLAGLTGVKSIAAGGEHCALTNGGEIWCWKSDMSASRRHVGASGAIQAIAVGSEHGCALLASGGVWCWGGNKKGQLGNGTLRASAPGPVIDLDDAVELVAAGNHSCARRRGGALVCWGAPDPAGRGVGALSIRPRRVPMKAARAR